MLNLIEWLGYIDLEWTEHIKESFLSIPKHVVETKSLWAGIDLRYPTHRFRDLA